MTGQKTQHLFWLDWLRFLAAFMVVAVHARGGLWLAWSDMAPESKHWLSAVFFALTRAGTEWVLVFFVLSGFLVGGKVAERSLNNTFDLKRYAMDRFTRIWMPLVPTLFWSAVVAMIVGGSVSWSGLAGNLLGLQGVLVDAFAQNYPLWSLAYEIWFYAMAGAVACLATDNNRHRLLAWLVIFLGFAIFTKLAVVFLFAWLIGGGTYHLLERPRNAALAWLGLALTVTGYVMSQLTSATVSLNLSAWQRFVPSNEFATLMLASGIALLLPFLSQWQPASRWLIRFNEAGTTLAAFSYTLYLTHYPLLYLWGHYLPDRYATLGGESIGIYLLRIGSCVLFAWLLYLPFERQTDRLRRFLTIR